MVTQPTTTKIKSGRQQPIRNSYSGKGAYETARRKARYGHSDWVAWTDKEGIEQARKVTPASIKECLLAKGTKGKWSLICANDAISMVGSWQIGLNILNQFKFGLRNRY